MVSYEFSPSQNLVILKREDDNIIVVDLKTRQILDEPEEICDQYSCYGEHEKCPVCGIDSHLSFEPVRPATSDVLKELST